MLSNFQKSILPMVLAMNLFACGGGGSEPAQIADPILTPPPLTSSTDISGGGVNDPTQMSAESLHLISKHDSQNFFYVDVEAGQRIVIWSELETYLDDQSFARCGASPTSYHVGISLTGTASSGCANNFEHTFEESGQAKFQFGYPYDNSGFFVYSIVGDNDDLGVMPANGHGGLPDGPRRINVDGENKIEINNLTNYYAYEGVAGETITLNSFLTDSIGGQDPTRCSSASGSQSLDSHYTYGFAVNDRKYNCDDDLTYTFETAGIATIHVKYIKKISGYFVFSSDK